MNTIHLKDLKKFSPSAPAPFGYFLGSISKKTREVVISRMYQDSIIPKFIGGKWFYDIVPDKNDEELKSITGTTTWYTLDSNGNVVSSVFSGKVVFFTVIIDRDFEDKINIKIDRITLLNILLLDS